MINPHQVIPPSPPHSTPGWELPSTLCSRLRPGRPRALGMGGPPPPRSPGPPPAPLLELPGIPHPSRPSSLWPRSPQHNSPPGRQWQSGGGRPHPDSPSAGAAPTAASPSGQPLPSWRGKGYQGSGARPRGQPRAGSWRPTVLVEVVHVLKLGVHSEAGSPSGTAWPDLAGTNGAEPHASHGSRWLMIHFFSLLPLSPSLHKPPSEVLWSPLGPLPKARAGHPNPTQYPPPTPTCPASAHPLPNLLLRPSQLGPGHALTLSALATVVN